jgi:FAD dependent oxidoreductase
MMETCFGKSLRIISLLILTCIIIITPAFSQTSLQADVLVIGGSTGGVAAGIQSARSGAKTIIIEPTSMLGGMLTAAGVSCTDGNDALQSGIWQEFRENLYHHYGTRNLFTGWVSETCFEPHVGDSIFKSMALKEKKLMVRHGFRFVQTFKKNNQVIGAIFHSGEDSLVVHAAITIDATDLGDVFAEAGAAYDLGMESPDYAGEKMAPGKNDIIQDLTWAAILKDYGPGSNMMIERPAHYDSAQYFCCCTDAPCLNGKPYQVNAKKMLDYGRLPNNKFMINWPAHGNDFYINAVEMEPGEREKYWQKAREKTLGFVYFIQKELGFRQLGLAGDELNNGMALIPYHREGRRIKGVVRLKAGNLTNPFSGKPLYRTGISVGDYPVDHHHSAEKKPPPIDFPEVPSFNIPMGALIPETMDGLIVAEKGISVSNIVNGSTRLQPCVLLTGQAAGILAAAAARQNAQPRNITVREVQQELLSAGAYLVPYCDINIKDRNWLSIQRVGVTGILRGLLKPEGWENKTFFRPDSTVNYRDFIHYFMEGLPTYKNKLEKLHLRDGEMTQEDLLRVIISVSKEKGINKTYPDQWIALTGKAFQPGRPVTRREAAVLTDHFVNPFLLQRVNMQGEPVR